MQKENYVKEKSKKSLTPATEAFADLDINEKLPQIDESRYKLNTAEFKQCRNILKKDEANYSEAEIIIIYTFLKELADIVATDYLKNNNYEKSNSNVEGEF